MDGISKSQISRLCGKIDERVNAFLTRPIEGDWPYIWLDAIRFNPALKATYQHLRQQGRPAKVALVAVMRKLLTILNAIIRDKKPWQSA